MHESASNQSVSIWLTERVSDTSHNSDFSLQTLHYHSFWITQLKSLCWRPHSYHQRPKNQPTPGVCLSHPCWNSIQQPRQTTAKSTVTSHVRIQGEFSLCETMPRTHGFPHTSSHSFWRSDHRFVSKGYTSVLPAPHRNDPPIRMREVTRVKKAFGELCIPKCNSQSKRNGYSWTIY